MMPYTGSYKTFLHSLSSIKKEIIVMQTYTYPNILNLYSSKLHVALTFTIYTQLTPFKSVIKSFNLHKPFCLTGCHKKRGIRNQHNCQLSRNKEHDIIFHTMQSYTIQARHSKHEIKCGEVSTIIQHLNQCRFNISVLLRISTNSSSSQSSSTPSSSIYLLF